MNELVGWTEERLDEKLNQSAAAHLAAGYEESADLALKEAGLLFVKGKDQEANILRDFAKALGVKGKLYRKEANERMDAYLKKYN